MDHEPNEFVERVVSPNIFKQRAKACIAIKQCGRMNATGDAFTLMSPDEQKDVQIIERFLGKSIPRVMLPDFDYKRRVDDKARAAGIEGSSRQSRGRDEGSRGSHADRGSRDSGRSRPARSTPA